jgi:hypothetical protein
VTHPWNTAAAFPNVSSPAHHPKVARNHLHATKGHQHYDKPAYMRVSITAQKDVLHRVLRRRGTNTTTKKGELSTHHVTKPIRQTIEAAPADGAAS